MIWKFLYIINKKIYTSLEKLKKEQLLVDNNVYFCNNIGTRNFVIAHEIIHWVFHRKIMLLNGLLLEEYSSMISCSIDENQEDNMIMDLNWMEWQANNLAARILMPLEPFKRKVDHLLNEYQLDNSSDSQINNYSKLINTLSKFYGVSLQSVKIRLVETGYDFAIGFHNYVDNTLVKPHAFKKGFLKSNQTFCISIEDATKFVLIELSNKNEDISNYRYVESHLCLNSPKYIITDSNNEPTLTTYAREHMDECCLVFEYVRSNISNDSDNYNFKMTLNKSKNNKTDLRFNEPISASPNNDIYKIADLILSSADLLFKIRGKEKGEAFKIVRKWSGRTISEIIEEANVSESSYDKASSGKKVSKEVMIRICIAMRTPWVICRHLLTIYEIPLSEYNVTEVIWELIFSCALVHSIDFITKLTKIMNIKMF